MEASHKFLGVILDHELKFKEHVAYVQGKGMMIATQVRRLARINGGVKGTFMRKMYEAVVVLSMMYAADVWCTPDVECSGKVVKGSRKFMGKLGRVQRMCALQILGALRMTLNNMVDTHAGLMPIPTRVKKICIEAAACIVTMLDMHLLYKPARRAVTFVRRHRALLHYIMKAFGRHLNDMEMMAIV
ncbi:hypothetical protein J132_02718 [Termitomyces sp. J132]|nr:hypothetical protein J132_02718 [Termitomyces sp. J132]